MFDHKQNYHRVAHSMKQCTRINRKLLGCGIQFFFFLTVYEFLENEKLPTLLANKLATYCPHTVTQCHMDAY
jgi:hypothetical protein